MTRQRDRGPGQEADAGYVAVLVALVLPLLVVLAALAVDVANWYAQAQKVQQAPDFMESTYACQHVRPENGNSPM